MEIIFQKVENFFLISWYPTF